MQTVVMVGDGITDLEAVQETGQADLFVGLSKKKPIGISLIMTS
jgi:phosphoglycolate phosphatase-like HAD superfamily hydrolase